MAVFPFEATAGELAAEPAVFVKAVCKLLESEFLVLPKGDGFIDYPTFDKGYEALKKATSAFTKLEPASVFEVISTMPVSLWCCAQCSASPRRSGLTSPRNEPASRYHRTSPARSIALYGRRRTNQFNASQS